jgi:hypothetical protein
MPFFQSQGGLRHTNSRMRCIKKTLTKANPIEIIAENQLIIGLTTMKFLLFITFAAGLLVLERPIIFGETFTAHYCKFHRQPQRNH